MAHEPFTTLWALPIKEPTVFNALIGVGIATVSAYLADEINKLEPEKYKNVKTANESENCTCIAVDIDAKRYDKYRISPARSEYVEFKVPVGDKYSDPYGNFNLTGYEKKLVYYPRTEKLYSRTEFDSFSTLFLKKQSFAYMDIYPKRMHIENKRYNKIKKMYMINKVLYFSGYHKDGKFIYNAVSEQPYKYLKYMVILNPLRKLLLAISILFGMPSVFFLLQRNN